MVIKKRIFLLFILLIVLILFMYQCYSSYLGEYEYHKKEDYYSYITKNLEANNSREMVVGYGVFDIFRKNNWLDIARMKVSIRNCVSSKGKVYDEITHYSDELEYWLINTSTGQVFGPYNKVNYINISKFKSHEYKLRTTPKDYSKYYFNTGIECYPESVIH
jgi:hypothetical protein